MSRQDGVDRVNLTEWARLQGVHPQTARKWFREGTLPVPAQRVGPRTILVHVEADAAAPRVEGVGFVRGCRLTIRRTILSGRLRV